MNTDLLPHQKNARPRRQPLRPRLGQLLAAAVLAGTASVASGETTSASSAVAPQASQTSDAGYATAVSYLTTFYPLWFTYYQSSRSVPDQLVGPVRVSPLYKTVVAINVDTVYASAFLDLSADAAVLTLPSTEATYSILVLDRYGNVLSTGLPKTPGVYALIWPFSPLTHVPAGATPIQVPDSYPVIIFRADKYSSTGVNQIADAEAFRGSLKLQSAAGYANDPNGGATEIISQFVFSFPFKGIADGLLERDPMAFLRLLQTAVHSNRTPTMTSDEKALATQFDALLAAGTSNPSLAAGARAAHQMLVSNYLQHVGATNWIISPILAPGAQTCSIAPALPSTYNTATISTLPPTIMSLQTAPGDRSMASARLATASRFLPAAFRPWSVSGRSLPIRRTRSNSCRTN